jgi:hypothetical protein
VQVVPAAIGSLDGLVALDDRSLLARFRAGTNGMAAERRVA